MYAAPRAGGPVRVERSRQTPSSVVVLAHTAASIPGILRVTCTPAVRRSMPCPLARKVGERSITVTHACVRPPTRTRMLLWRLRWTPRPSGCEGACHCVDQSWRLWDVMHLDRLHGSRGMRGFGTIYHGIAVALHSVKHMRKSSLQVPISIF